eukprot:TRINITY_DN14370_c0_g1_i3.p2 TRINITY_DN14370_c0_g1~~TRINITY_DN14370_c0_g1_i3.p2  ORF type:complete len:346 (-),score=97.25 TRINITY_DN14370_c0_g1_i3:73-1110(-)
MQTALQAMMGCVVGQLSTQVMYLSGKTGENYTTMREMYIALVVVFELFGKMTLITRLQQTLDGEPKLDFVTMKDARCESVDDELGIRAALSGAEEDVDRTINLLKAVGTFGEWVVEDQQMGFDPRTRRQFCYTQALATCVLWSFLTLSAVQDISGLCNRPFALIFMIPPAYLMYAAARTEPRVRRAVFMKKLLWDVGLALLAVKFSIDMLKKSSGKSAEKSLSPDPMAVVYVPLFILAIGLQALGIMKAAPEVVPQADRAAGGSETGVEMVTLPKSGLSNFLGPQKRDRSAPPRKDTPRTGDNEGNDAASPWLNDHEAAEAAKPPVVEEVKKPSRPAPAIKQEEM